VEKTRPILYGVADYAQIRKKNAFEEFFSGTDIALKPRLDRWPDIAHAVLVAEHVTLHRLVLVFHGGDCVLSEEV